MVEEILEKDADAVKSHVEENVEDLDLKQMIAVEEENENRENLLLWLLKKQKRRQLLQDEERIEELLSHTEYAYRTAAISQETYDSVKQANKELLRDN